MAQLDGYATAARYRALGGDVATATDETLDAQLVAVSRLLERALGVLPGAFNSHTATYVFTGSGERLLYLRTDEGLGAFLQSVTSIGVDTEQDGSNDGETFTLASPWVRGWPSNAAAGSEPYTGLEIRPGISGAELSAWPKATGIAIAGTWGWAAVPGMIADLVVHRTRELRESLKAGETRDLPGFDGGVPMSRTTSWMFREAEALYGRRLPVVG